MGEGRYGLLMKDNKTALDVHSPGIYYHSLHDTELKLLTIYNRKVILTLLESIQTQLKTMILNEVNTSSDTILYNIDTENYAQSDHTRNTSTKSGVKINKTKKKITKQKLNTKYKILQCITE